MHLWTIDPSARKHLVTIIGEAIDIDGRAKIELIEDGTLGVSSWTSDSVATTIDRVEGITMMSMFSFDPAHGELAHLVDELLGALRWQMYIIASREETEEGVRLFFTTARAGE